MLGLKGLKRVWLIAAVGLVATGILGRTAAVTEAAAGEEVRLRLVTPYPVSTLDPIKSVAAGDIEILGQIYSRLLRRDVNFELQPALAESWEASDDGLTWTFRLREAKFSDGSPITADDVVFSYLRLRDQEDSAYGGAFQVIKDVVALDERTARFTLKHSAAPFLGSTEMFNAGIVPKKVVEALGDEEFARKPVTSGPFMVEEWRPSDRVILLRNPHYWREGRPNIDVIEWIEVPDENTRVSMLQAGEADVAREIPWVAVDQFKDSEEIIAPLNQSSVITTILLNHKDSLIQDLRVRKALAMAIDREGITKVVTFGYATPANSPLPSSLDYYYAELDPIPYDPEKAKQLIEEAGATGAKIEFMAGTGGSVWDQATQLIQDQLRTIGLDPYINPVDTATWWDKVTTADYQATVSWWYNETPDPDTAVRWALCGACGNSSFYTYYNNDEINKLTEEGLRETDPQKREELYFRIQEIALEEVANIPIWYKPYRNAMRSYVKGLFMNPAIQWTFEDARVEG